MSFGLRRERWHGFALLAVLWVMIGVGILALGVSLAGHMAVATTRNRVALTTAQWRARGCIERLRAAASEALGNVHHDAAIVVWDTLGHMIEASPYVTNTSCVITTHPTGTQLNINTADPIELERFFHFLDIAPSRADSLIDALLDWRDSDTLPRVLGAERTWYRAQRRLLPRDSAFADPHELLFVRGFEHFGDTLTLLGTDAERISLAHAPLPVLATLPGFTEEALDHVQDIRHQQKRMPDLLAFSRLLSKAAQHTLLTHYAELLQRTTNDPDGWIITVAVAEGTPPVWANTEIYLARAGTRVAIRRLR